MSQIICPALVWPPWDSIPTIPGVGQVGALRFSELSPCLVPCALDLIPNTLSAQDTGPTLPLGPSAVKVLRAAANTNSLASSKQNYDLDLEAQACHPSYSGAEASGQKVKGLSELQCESKVRLDRLVRACLKG